MARPGLENSITAGVDSIEHGIAIPDDLLDRMKAQGIYLCPTLTVTEYVAPGRAAEGRPIWAQIPVFHRDTFARALRKGVKIAFGTDVGGFPWEVNQAREFSYETKFGMTHEAINSATSVASHAAMTSVGRWRAEARRHRGAGNPSTTFRPWNWRVVMKDGDYRK